MNLHAAQRFVEAQVAFKRREMLAAYTAALGLGDHQFRAVRQAVLEGGVEAIERYLLDYREQLVRQLSEQVR